MATVLEWPSGILPASFDWSLQSAGSTFTSPWNQQTQSVRYPGSAWKAAMTLSNLDDYESRYVEVLLVQMDGYAGLVKLRDFGRAPATVKGTPIVATGGQTGTNLVTKGWTASTKVLSLGDYITVNNELKLVLADVTSNASGNATIPIGPQLRTSPAVNAAIEVAQPYGIFRLTKDNNGPSRLPGIVNNFTLEFQEAFGAN